MRTGSPFVIHLEAWHVEADEMPLLRALGEWDREQEPDTLRRAVDLATRQGQEEVMLTFLADYAGDLFEDDEWFTRKPYSNAPSYMIGVSSKNPFKLEGGTEISWTVVPDLKWTRNTGIPTCRAVGGMLTSRYQTRKEFNLPQLEGLRFEVAYLFHLAAGESVTRRAIYAAFPGPGGSA